MTLYLNGEAQEHEGVGDIRALVVKLGLPERAVLVEHNGLALRREEWDGRRLSHGDRLEIIRIVAGG